MPAGENTAGSWGPARAPRSPGLPIPARRRGLYLPRGTSLSKCQLQGRQLSQARAPVAGHVPSAGASPSSPCPRLTSLGSREMKSLWNWGSITCIMYLIWEGSQRSMSSSRARKGISPSPAPLPTTGGEGEAG
uniref:Uncharacterized protein n=1 Tax=Bubo bubo TaxID=30461 RepID=A0A8C0E9I2_BUBBB